MANRRLVHSTVFIPATAPPGFAYLLISQQRRNNEMGVIPYSHTRNTLVLTLRYEISDLIWCKKQAFTVFQPTAAMVYIQAQVQIVL